MLHSKAHHVYVLRCADGSLYTGYTTDIKRRINEHNTSVKGAKYTRGRRPVVLVYHECFATKSEALMREHAIRILSKQKKEALILKNRKERFINEQ